MTSTARLIVMAGVLSLLSLSVASCKREASWKKNSFANKEMRSATAEVPLPSSLWDKLQEVYEQSPHGEGGGSGHGGGEKAEGGGHGGGEKPEGGGHGGSEKAEGGGHGSSGGETPKAGEVPTDFMPLSVYLIEKNKGILGGRNHRLRFAPGGGELDLRDFADDQKGTFYFLVQPDFEEDVGAPRVFYLSNAVRRSVQGEKVGAGCHSYYDISSFFSKAMTGQGIMVNTTAGRHVSTLAGTYFFAVVHSGRLFLAHLKVKDSRWKSLHCR